MTTTKYRGTSTLDYAAGMNRKIKFAFFGTTPLARGVLDELAKHGFLPRLIVAGADRIDSRTKTILEPPEKVWAREHDIQVMQPESNAALLETLKQSEWDLFVVASYGKILSAEMLSLPKRGVLNVHPSLLPRLRGPSPIRSAIIRDERNTGVSIMLMDEEMDHGPLLAQKSVTPGEWPPRGAEFDELMAKEGGLLLAAMIPEWMNGNIEPRPQNHDLATYTEKIEKEDGLLDLRSDAYQNLLKMRAYEGWPGTYVYFERSGKKIRVAVVEAHLENGALVVDTVKPEGKREMAYDEFLRSGAKPMR